MNSRFSFLKLSGVILVTGFLLIGTFASINAGPLAQATGAPTTVATTAPTMAATGAPTMAATSAATATATTSTAGGGAAPSATPVPTNTASAPTKAPAAAGPSETAKCVPAEVAVFVKSPRIHVKCASPTNGILFFAVGTTDVALAQRVLTIMTEALVAKKALSIVYDSTDLSGSAIGCLNADCRLIVTISILP